MGGEDDFFFFFFSFGFMKKKKEEERTRMREGIAFLGKCGNRKIFSLSFLFFFA